MQFYATKNLELSFLSKLIMSNVQGKKSFGLGINDLLLIKQELFGISNDQISKNAYLTLKTTNPTQEFDTHSN